MASKTADRLWLVAAFIAPVLVGAALVPVRGHVDNANVALVLVVAVVAVAAGGRRLAAAVSAVSAAAAFDFFHTRPFGSLTVSSSQDLQTNLLLLVVGLVVGELAARGRRHRQEAAQASDDIARIHAAAELVAAGEPIDYLIMVVATQLRELLALRDCRFQLGAPQNGLPRIERNGDVVWVGARWGVHRTGLPGAEVELIVQGEGEPLGRFLLVPTPGEPVSFDRRVVAVALADQVGAALAAHPIA